MAVDKHGSDIATSIHGRRLGLDGDGLIAGTGGVRPGVETSTATSTLAAYGVSVLTGSTASHTLPAPALGVRKTIINASSVSTATMTITRSSSSHYILGSTGGDEQGAVVALLNSGSAIDLVGISTSAWAMTGTPGSTLYQSITTSS